MFANRHRALLIALLAGLTLLGVASCREETRPAGWSTDDAPRHDTAPRRPTANTPLRQPDDAPDVAADAKPRPARFLIATRQQGGPIFAKSVVLLLDYSRAGALGLIVNRPTDLSLDDLLPALDEMSEREDRVFLGGPVETQMMVFLIRSDSVPPDSQRVIGDVHATGSADALRAVIAQGAPESRFHAYVGYAGWAPGQLDAEIARGDWYVAPASPDAVFDASLGDLWERLVFEHEGTLVRARHREHPAQPAAHRPNPATMRRPDDTT